MTAETWPPPPTHGAPWHARRLRTRGGGPASPFTVREVKLWGQQVLIDQENAVYCPDCWRFIAVTKLAAPDNHHRIGLRRPPDGIFRTAEDEGEPTTRQRPVWDLEF